ncbi:MAG: hypothetical protein MRJ92_12105 [Nitrospira sp.]|nr:hypothetical protein [Nitrospira sp.]
MKDQSRRVTCGDNNYSGGIAVVLLAGAADGVGRGRVGGQGEQVLIPKGEFTMGSNESRRDSDIKSC